MLIYQILDHMNSQNIEKIKNEIYQNGFSVIDNFLCVDQLKKVNKEFNDKLSNIENNNYSENGFQGTIYSHQINNSSSQFYKLIRNRLLIDLRNEFYKYWLEDYSNKICNYEKIDLESNNKVGLSNNSIFHYDRIPSIKIQIYLNNVDKKNGAISFIKKSHLDVRPIVEKMLQKNNNPMCLKNYLTSQIKNNQISTIEAAAGTAIIFDTMTLHQGGKISEGHRNVIRLVSNIPNLCKKFFKVNYSTKNIANLQEKIFNHPFSHKNYKNLDERYFYK